nr:MAG TPA: hypothetical protein [Caudoviricetes sp.]
MKAYHSLLVLSLIFSSLSFSNYSLAYENNTNMPYSPNKRYKILKVYDGDTFDIDFNGDGIAQTDERVRVNGIDTFASKPNEEMNRQMSMYNMNKIEVLTLGFLAKKFAKEKLLNKYVYVVNSAERERDIYNRHLVSIYYGKPKKNYEIEVLKRGLATVYKKSNLAKDYQKYEDFKKIISYSKTAPNYSFAIRNNLNGKYHTVNCKNANLIGDAELVDTNKLKEPVVYAKCCSFSSEKNLKPVQNKNTKKLEKQPLIKIKEINRPNYKSDSLELYLIDFTKYKAPANYCRTAACQALVNDLNSANSEIDFAIYGFSRQPEVYNALVNASKNGINVRGITDMDKDNHNIYSDTEALIEELGTVKTDYLTTKRLENLKAEYWDAKRKQGYYKGNIEHAKYIIEGREIYVKTSSKAPLPIQEGIMHDKYFILDDSIVWTGSTNMSSGCLGGYNSNVMVRIKSEEVAQCYKKDFNQMYESELFSQWKAASKNNENINLKDGSKISVYFLPQDKAMEDGILPLIRNSKKYIYIMTFYLTETRLAQELINAKERGVDVRIILDANGASNDYSKHHILRQASIPVKVENYGGKMHMKSIIVDDEAFVVGSMNLTGTAQTKNNENTNIIWNSNATEVYKKHFLKIYSKIPDEGLYKDYKPESPESKGTCSDGLDNDHDGLVDEDTPYCSNYKRLFYRWHI